MLNVIFLISFFVGMLQTDILIFFKTIPLGVQALLLLALLNSGFALSLPVFAYFVWKEDTISRVRKIHFTLVALAALCFIWFVSYWNLL